MKDRQVNFVDTMENLISHMNNTRRLYLVLIIAAFVIAPASLIFAVIMLSPSIVSETGPDYTLTVEFEEDMVMPPEFFEEYYYYVPFEDEIFGEFEGEFVGKMLGDNMQDDTGKDKEAYYGEFVGKFEGEIAVMSGQFVGKFEGTSNDFYDDIENNDNTSFGTFGLYEGQFVGKFEGAFYNMQDESILSKKIKAIDISEFYDSEMMMMPTAYDIEFIPIDSHLDSEYSPRFMAIGNESVPYQQTDITWLIVVFIVTVIFAGALVLYVGIREFSFYSNWAPRFKRYIEQKEAIDKELDND